MSADTLRIILLILGTCLVAGIYLWDRFQREYPRNDKHGSRRERRTPVISDSAAEADADRDTAAPEDPPAVELSAADVVAGRPDDDLESGPEVEGERQDAAEELIEEATAQEPVGEQAEDVAQDRADEAQPAENWQLRLDEDPQVSTDMNFSAHEDTDYLHQVTELDDELPRLILQINVVARVGEFNGKDLAAAFKDVGLKAGELDIYHRFDAQRTEMVVFSVANMLEPGSFPVRRMATFTTTGITLFTQLPGVRDGFTTYDDMVSTAQTLARALGAELQDESGSTLSGQGMARTKDLILEFQRELALARRRA